jgi:hypothetical protein
MTTNRTADFNKGTARLNRKFEADVRALWHRRAIHVKSLTESGEWLRLALRDPYHRRTGKDLARGHIEMATGIRQFGGL